MKITDWESTDEGLHLIVTSRRWRYIPFFKKTTRVRYHPYHLCYEGLTRDMLEKN